MSNGPSNAPLRHAARQQQFLHVIDRDEATRRFHEHLHLGPLGTQTVSLADALNRVSAVDVVSSVDVPAFDRANVDGFSLRARDTYGAAEEQPRTLPLNDEILSPGIVPRGSIRERSATTIATGGMVPRGADAVIMIEHTEWLEEEPEPAIQVTRPVVSGENITFAGTDVAKGETVIRAGQLLTSREIGVLAAVGLAKVEVYRRPTVAVISTGDEVIAPGEPPRPGCVYDSNAAIISAAVVECGGEPISYGVIPDDDRKLDAALRDALEQDVVILSGGTSKGAGDLSHRVAGRLKDPGIVAHGVSLKPGKPICLAVTEGKPVVILPGFPTSAIFTFHEFLGPVIRAFSGLPAKHAETLTATLPVRVNSDKGRTEYLLVSLVRSDGGLAAYPMGKGSGSVTTFSCADGFITIDQHTEIVDAGSQIRVQLLGHSLEPADLVSIGSHCVGLDFLLGQLQRRGLSVKALHVGSMGGLAAARRGECDIAGIHLLDPKTGEYNRPFLSAGLVLFPGYKRMQGIVFRAGDARFENKSVMHIAGVATSNAECTMINRNAGSGTRILIDELLKGAEPAGYGVQAKSHNAVAAAVSQKRADWGVAIDTVASRYGLAFVPLKEEHYDFAVPEARLDRPAVKSFLELLEDRDIRRGLAEMGFRI